MEAVAGAFTLTGDVDADSVLERVAIKAGLSFAFFAAIFAAGAAVARALVPKDKYEAVPANKRVIWGECWSSTAHGLFVGFGAAILALVSSRHYRCWRPSLDGARRRSATWARCEARHTCCVCRDHTGHVHQCVNGLMCTH